MFSRIGSPSLSASHPLSRGGHGRRREALYQPLCTNSHGALSLAPDLISQRATWGGVSSRDGGKCSPQRPARGQTAGKNAAWTLGRRSAQMHPKSNPPPPGLAPRTLAHLCGVRVLVLQLLQVQLVDLPKNQQLPVQELHLLLDRLAVREL